MIFKKTWARLLYCWIFPAFAGYIAFFLIFYAALGESAAIFSFVPPLIVAWKCGMRCGILATPAAIIIMLALFQLKHVNCFGPVSLLHRSPGIISVFLIATIVGYLSDLRKRIFRELEDRNKIEAELRKQSGLIQGIYLAAPVGISLSINRIMQTVNFWLCEISGFTEEEVVGKSARMFYVDDAEFERAGVEMYKNTEKGGRSYTEARWRRKDGALIDVSLRISPVNPGDLSKGHVVSVLDITRRKKAEKALVESEASFRKMFEITSEGVTLIDPKTGRFFAANPAMCLVFGYTEEEFCTMTPEDITPVDRKEIMRNSMKLLFEAGDVEDHEGTSLKKDGSKVHSLIRCKRLLWKGQTVFYVTFKDVTFLKEIERQLQQKNRELLEFMNSATHDLKKPLTTMQSIFSILQLESFESLSNEVKEALTLGDDAISYMKELLDDLLASAKLEAGISELTIEEIDFTVLARETVGRLKFQIEEKKIDVSFGDDIGLARADKKAMTKVFMNLIGNAVNYIGEGPNRKIIIGAKTEDSGKVLYIRDNGMGIPEESQKTIFQRFKRGVNVGDISGTGLGLSIVKGNIEAHGGKIWVESVPGKGTTFYFTLGASGKSAP
jgi:PAS domain S-box-containing protein